jgi:hypothetical protein
MEYFVQSASRSEGKRQERPILVREPDLYPFMIRFSATRRDDAGGAQTPHRRDGGLMIRAGGDLE